MMRRYELIVFDLDGTLMDSAAILSCLAAAAVDVAIPHPGEEAARDVIGLGMEEASMALFPDLSPSQRADFLVRFREHYLYSWIGPRLLVSRECRRAYGSSHRMVTDWRSLPGALAVALTGCSRRQACNRSSSRVAARMKLIPSHTRGCCKKY